MDKESSSKSPINPRHINDTGSNFQMKQFNHSPQSTEKTQQTTPKTMNTFSSQQQHQQQQQQFISNLKQVKNKPSTISNANSSPPKSTIYINNSSLSANNLNSGEDVNTLPSVQERIEQFQQISNQRQQQRPNAFNVGNLNNSNQSLISNNGTPLTNTPTSSNNSNTNKLFNRPCNNTPTLNSQNTFNSNNNNNINGFIANTNGINEQKESSPKTIKLANNAFSSSNDNLNLNNYNNSNGETTLVRQNIQSHNSALNRLNILQQQQLTYNNNLKDLPSSVASPTSSSSPQANLKAIRQVTINSTSGNSSNSTVLETVLKGKLITFEFLECFIEHDNIRKAYGKLRLFQS